MSSVKSIFQHLEIDDSLLQLFGATPVPMVLSRVDGSFEYVNTALLDLLGYREDEIYNPDLLITHPDDFDLNEIIRKQLNLDPFSPVITEKRYVHKSGKSLIVILTIVAQADHDNKIIRYIAQLVDITDRKKTEEKLKMASLVYNTSSEGMMVTDADGTVQDVNSSFSRITGYTKNDIVGKNANMLNSGVQDSEYYKSMWDHIESTGQWKGEIWNKKKNGEIYPGLISINSESFEDGTVNRRIALFTDLTQMKANEELIHRQAYYDSITGLPNRNMYLGSLEQAMKKSDEEQLPLAVLLIDLDGFKEVNDLLGHDTGDQLLKNTASRLLKTLRDTDTVARLGGDEFAILMKGIQDTKIIDDVLDNILKELSEPFNIINEQIFISASIGVTLYPEDSVTASELLKNADQAMYAAKKQGRNCYFYFARSLQQDFQARLKVISELRDAVNRQQFALYYQPIVNLSTDEIYKAEALVRWQHPEKGIINPDDFIKVAEETGLIVGIGNWVIKEALQQAFIWREKIHEDFQVSINKSPLQFKSEQCAFKEWFSFMSRLGLKGDSVIIEITENVLMDASDSIDQKMQELIEANVRFSLDDFGTGYSSLSYLKRFNFEYLKIDRSYVQNLDDGTNEYILCETIIQMAHKLGIKVIAEGIETEKQLAMLKDSGCDYGQGFLFSKPLPVNEFEDYLSRASDIGG